MYLVYIQTPWVYTQSLVQSCIYIKYVHKSSHFQNTYVLLRSVWQKQLFLYDHISCISDTCTWLKQYQHQNLITCIWLEFLHQMYSTKIMQCACLYTEYSRKILFLFISSHSKTSKSCSQSQGFSFNLSLYRFTMRWFLCK